MTSGEIQEYKTEIKRALAKGQLKEAFEYLHTLAIDTQDWLIADQISQLETNYKYMLHYLFEGVEDPERKKVYNNLVRSLHELTDDMIDDLLKIESSNTYYSKLRNLKITTTTLAFHQKKLREVVLSISLTGLLNNADEKRILSVERERLSDNMFNTVLVSERADAKNVEEYLSFVNDIELSDREKCVFISALTLNLVHKFDNYKMQVLMHATQSTEASVRARAVVGFVVIMQMYSHRWMLYPELQHQLDIHCENSAFSKSVLSVIIQLIRSRETERISKKLTEEILPEMMRFNRSAGKKINMDELMGETDLTDKNPEWQKELEESGLTEKLQEYTNLQMEGADVFHSTFSGLKNYPFFGDMSNWFLPFDPNYSEIASLFAGDGQNTLLNAAIVDSGHMCNSDKYSFCLSLQQISASQRSMMMSRLGTESEELKQMQKDSKDLNPTIDEEVLSNQYIQDLYRFFKINTSRNSFYDIFNLSIDFYNKEPLVPLISDVESMKKIALYCFEKNNFKEALHIFTMLANKDDNQSKVWQKIAYCKQMLNDIDGALQAYLKADLISPNNTWILRHIAQLYRNLKQPDKAIIYYQKVASLNPDNLNIELNIGHCYLEQNDFENALNSYFKVEILDSNGMKALRPIAWTAFLESRYDLAKKYYDRILSKKPTTHDYLNAGHVQLCANNIKDAVQLYRSAVEVDSLKHFEELLLSDKEILLDKGLNPEIIALLLDQIKYKS